jgi:hypothetical protein
MSDPFVGDDLDELAVGRGEVDKTEVPDWIILSGCSARALQLYQLLRLRLNRRRRDRKVWPGLATLAVMMKLTTSESVSPYIKELKALGAIDVEHGNMPRRNIYRIHFAPPDGYAGPMCIEDWDSDPGNRLAAKKIRDLEKEKRDKMRGGSTAKRQVKPEPGKNPVQARAGKAASPDPGKIRDQEPGKTLAHDPGFFGVEPLGVTGGSSVTGRSPSASSEDAAASCAAPAEQQHTPEQQQEEAQFSKIEDQEAGYAADGYPLTVTDWEAELIGELVRRRPDWGPRLTRIAVGHPSVRARTADNPGLVRRTFLLAAADKGRPKEGYRGTYTPKRLTTDGCPLWSRALAEMDAEAAAEIEDGQPDFASVATAANVPAARTKKPMPGTRVVPIEKKGPPPEYLAARAALDQQREAASA